MAVNINTVYQTVLYIINKEQRGYITPAEFNSLATQVQDEIFQSYFPDGNQVNRVNQNNTQNDTEFFDMFKDISYKLYPFESVIEFAYDSTAEGWYGSSEIYKLGEIISTYKGQPQFDSITQLASKKDYDKIIRSKLTAPTKKFPICTVTHVTSNTSLSVPIGSLLIKVDPIPDILKINCLKQPKRPRWGFTVGPQGQYIFQGGSSTNFELDTSEQTNIITNILKYCGIIIKDPTIIQTAEQESKSVEANLKS
tara:strand:- start:485 stop:1243 length:759 start_codon:yes stop_codon:yes gene_type:complete